MAILSHFKEGLHRTHASLRPSWTRGPEDVRRDSVVIKTDASGEKYATMAYNELTKNHQSVAKDKSYEEQQPMMVTVALSSP